MVEASRFLAIQILSIWWRIIRTSLPRSWTPLAARSEFTHAIRTVADVPARLRLLPQASLELTLDSENLNLEARCHPAGEE